MIEQPGQLQLQRHRAALLVIDVQVRLVAAMPEERMRWVQKNTQTMLSGARELGLPIVVTEQYPKGIGATIAEVLEVLPEDHERIPKVDFSCCAVPEVMKQLDTHQRKQLILCGMETHICVFQTARDLLRQGYEVFVPQDTVISRSDANHEIGLQLMERAGAVITSTETALFDMLEKAGTPEFKVISKLIK